MRRGVAAAALMLAAVAVAACTSTPAPPVGQTTTFGDTTVTVGGRVRVESSYVD